MPANPNTNFTAGAVLTAAQQNRFPRGIMGEAASTTAYTLTGTTADIPGMSVTFTAAASRLYKVTFTSTNVMPNPGTDRMLFNFTDGSNNVITNIYQAGTVYGVAVTFTELIAPAAGSYTVKARAKYDIGTGGSIYAAANSPMRLIVEDMGPI